MKAARFLVMHFWLFCVPLFLGTFLTVVHLANAVNLSFLPSPALLQMAVAAAILAAVLAIPYMVWRKDFDRAREELALERDAELGLKDARRRLRRYGSRLGPAAKREVEATADRVGELLRGGPHSGLGQAVTELESAMQEHLHFARKGPAREYAESIGVAVFIALVLRAFVVEAFKIPSGSMIPTLQVGDHIFVNKFIYGVRIPWTNIKLGTALRPPRRGEVVVFIYPQEPDKDFIKRIVAVAGDEVDIQKGQVFINGQALPREEVPGPCTYEDYVEEAGEWRTGECEAFWERNGAMRYNIINDRQTHGMRGGGILSFPYKVPDRHVFVMGDNRDNSHDSRYWGPVPYDLIKGKAWIIWWSAGRGSSVRLERMFNLIHR